MKLTELAAKRKPRVGTGVILWRSDGSFLLQQRGRGCGAGKWSVPGGRAEYGETIEETGVRELREETSLVPVAGLTPVTVTTDIHDDCGEHWVTVWLEGGWAGGEPVVTDECVQFRWCLPTELPEAGLWQPAWDNLRKTLWWAKTVRTGAHNSQ